MEFARNSGGPSGNVRATKGKGRVKGKGKGKVKGKGKGKIKGKVEVKSKVKGEGEEKEKKQYCLTRRRKGGGRGVEHQGKEIEVPPGFWRNIFYSY